MRNILITVVTFLTVGAFAATSGKGRAILSEIGPSHSRGAMATIAAPAAGVRNCITEIDAVTHAPATLRILQGGTTSYAVDLTSGTTVVRAWDLDDAFCAAAATAMYIKIDTASAGGYEINYQGYTY